VRNAGSIRAQGVELEGQAKPTANVNIDFGVAYLDSKFTSNHQAPGLPACTGAVTSCPTTQDLTGRRRPISPKWQAIWAPSTSQPRSRRLHGHGARRRQLQLAASSSTNDLSPQGIVDEVTLYGGAPDPDGPDRQLAGRALRREPDQRADLPHQVPAGPRRLFGVRNPATATPCMRGFMGTPRTYGARISKTF
jgi:iron complex outermembrane receptor protein